jgi:tRNA threonylcarbamoyladenosine biosynthesis protein TsaE
MESTLSILPGVSLSIPLSDDEATTLLGRQLAQALPDSGSALVMHLRGELGAGKTTIARSMLKTLGVAGVVRSPTYTLVEPYATPAWQCVHIDLYRLRGPEELDDLGLGDYLVPRHLLLIEWPERGGTRLPGADLDLSLTYGVEASAAVGRTAHLTAGSDSGRRWLETYVVTRE